MRALLRAVVVMLFLPTAGSAQTHYVFSDGESADVAEAMFPDAFAHPTRDFLAAQGQGIKEGLQQMGDVKQKVEAALAEDRKNFWASYPNGSTHAKDAEKLSQDLWVKDNLYIQQEIMPNKTRVALNFMSGGALVIDNGIAPTARTEWISWINGIKRKIPGDVSLLDLIPAILNAVASNTDGYARYVVARDWAEIDAGHPQLAPSAYAAMLVQRYPRAKTAAEADEGIKALVSLFGEGTMKDLAQKVRDVQSFDPDDGYVLNGAAITKLGLHPEEKPDDTALATTGTPVIWIQNDKASPFDAWLALLGQTNPRGFLVGQWVQYDYDPRSDEYAFRLRWQEGIAWYNLLTASFGESAVVAAAEKVRAAQQAKTPNHVLGTDLGLRGCWEVTAVLTLLTKADPAGFAKYLMAHHQNLAPKDAQDLAALTSTYGQDKVTTAMGSTRDNILSEGLISPDEDPYTRLLSYLNPVQANDPVYISWSKWPVGTWAIYHSGSSNSDVDGNAEILLQLKSINPQGLILTRSKRTSDPSDSFWTEIHGIDAYHAPDEKGVVRLPLQPTELLKTMSDSHPLPDGSFPYDGRSLTCHIRSYEDELSAQALGERDRVYFSDEVPGLFVQYIETKSRGRFRQESLIAFKRGNGTAVDPPLYFSTTSPFTEWPPMPPAFTGPSEIPASNVPDGAPVPQRQSSPPAPLAASQTPEPPPPPSSLSPLAVRNEITQQQRDDLVALLKKGPRYSGTCLQQAYKYPVEAELNWSDDRRMVTGWIDFPTLGAKKKVMGSILNEQGKSVLFLRETGIVERSPGSTALVGVVYQLALDKSSGAQLRGPWLYPRYSGELILGLKAQ